jgi:PAS domain S-box-containing protein
MKHDQHAQEAQNILVSSPAQSQHTQEAAFKGLATITEATLADLLSFSPDALIIVCVDGTITYANEQALTLFGYQQGEVLGQTLECLLPERFREVHLAHRAAYTASPRQRPMGAGLHLFGRRKDGSEFPIDISLRPVRTEQASYVIGAIRDMTIQYRLEQERLQQAERLRIQADLINLSHDAILIRDPISRILSWNHGAQELYGWSAQEALGRVTHTLLQTRAPMNLADIVSHLEREGRWEGELTHTHRDGRIVIVESRQVLIRNAEGTATAVLEINRDITRRRQLEQAQSTVHATTLAQRTFLQHILDALPSSIYVVHGKDARLLLANQTALTIWGAQWPLEQPMQAFLAANHIQIMDPQGQPSLPETWATTRALLQGEIVYQHQEIIHQPNGKRLPTLVNAVPLSSSYWQSMESSRQYPQERRGHETLALVIHQDVSALKETEHLKDEFIGIAAHELRTPLAILKTAVSSLIRQAAHGHGTLLEDWQLEMLEDVEQATDRLTDLTGDLLDVTRLQSGRNVLQRAPTNIVSLIRRVVERLRQTTTRHSIELQTTQGTLEATIDAKRIEQVITNLLSNAIKYSPRGGVITVCLAVRPAENIVEIWVQDTGIGIPQQQQASIFGRFIRADNAKAAGISGTGLGLYLCRSLVEQHGGSLWFTSQEGKGSTFFLTLPIGALSQGENAPVL